MIKGFSAFFIALSIASSINAQLKLGPTVGFQLTSQQINFSNTVINKSVAYIPSYRIGLQGELAMNENTALHTGLALSGKGSFQYGTDKIRLTYLEVPFILSTTINKMRNSEVIAGAGGYAAYLIHSANKRFNSVSISDFYKNFDFGISALAGVRINKQWLVSLNYTLGLMQIRYNVSPLAYYESKERNTTFHLSVAYFFPVRK